MLKNTLGAGAYLLVTQPAVTRAAIDPSAAGMRRLVLSYPYLGEIPCFVADLAPLRMEVVAGASRLRAAEPGKRRTPADRAGGVAWAAARQSPS